MAWVVVGGVDVDAVSELLQPECRVDDETLRSACGLPVSCDVPGDVLDVLRDRPMPRSGCMNAMRSLLAMSWRKGEEGRARESRAWTWAVAKSRGEKHLALDSRVRCSRSPLALSLTVRSLS